MSRKKFVLKLLISTLLFVAIQLKHVSTEEDYDSFLTEYQNTTDERDVNESDFEQVDYSKPCIRVCCGDDGNMSIPDTCPYEFRKKLYHEATGQEISIEKSYRLCYNDLICDIDEKTGWPYKKRELEYRVFEVTI